LFYSAGRADDTELEFAKARPVRRPGVTHYVDAKDTVKSTTIGLRPSTAGSSLLVPLPSAKAGTVIKLATITNARSIAKNFLVI